MKDYTILLIEDEKNIADFIEKILRSNDYKVVTASTGGEGLSLIKSRCPDIILLDLGLPDMDGLDVISSVRSWSLCPIIVLSARTTDNDKVSSLDLGADDYISKPFMPQELLLRVYAVLRRTYKEDSPRVFLDGCTIDFSRAEVNKGGEIIPLTAKEHTLLETLARNEGKIVTVDALCEALWGDNPFGYENSLNAHVRRIREKIEADPSKPVSLITIKGLGYKLITRK